MMSKKGWLLALLILINVNLNAQEVADSYYLKFFDKTYNIALMEEGTDPYVFLDIASDDKNNDVTVILSGEKDITEFKTMLSELKAKFEKWQKVAKENNVKDFYKDFNIKSPKVTVSWRTITKWYHFNETLNFRFLVYKDGKCMATAHNTVTSSSNKNIDEKYYLVFSSPEEIEELSNKIDLTHLRNKISKQQTTDALFK